MFGYKVFNSNMTCRGFQYEIGKTYVHDGHIELCASGFHFCVKAIDCFKYYEFSSTNRVCRVEALGNIVESDTDTKVVTDKIKILEEISWYEVLDLVNIGDGNTGYRNTGNWNTGDRNTGNYNTGDRNIGHRNTGDCNTGDRNIGHRNTSNYNTGDRNTGDMNRGNYNTGDRNTGNWNTGYRNTGHKNTGDMNTGHCNTGYWNTGNHNTGDRNTGDMNTGKYNVGNHFSGFFCSGEAKMMLFNKPTELTFYEVSDLISFIQINTVEFVDKSDMTKEEKEEHPEYETIGGYLKKIPYKEAWGNWWKFASKEDKNAIKNLPNFDAEIFLEITGIDVYEMLRSYYY